MFSNNGDMSETMAQCVIFRSCQCSPSNNSEDKLCK